MQVRRATKTTSSAPLAAGTTTGRFLIEDVYPSVDCGRFRLKRIAGEPVEVWADILRDGHDVLAASLRWRRQEVDGWQSSPMTLRDNDRWHGTFLPAAAGQYVFAIEAWTDTFGTWRRDYLLKRTSGAAVASELAAGRQLLNHVEPNRAAAEVIRKSAQTFDDHPAEATLLDESLAAAMAAAQPRSDLTRSAPVPLVVDRERARAGAWYELFPRSQSRVPGRHGTLADCVERVPEIAALGFDVLYFPPIHPIGKTNRKGKNNALTAAADDPGSPYAIGSDEGGHDALHPELGTLDDFRRVVAACAAHGMEVALDFAVQCSPDHPWVRQHPEWFKWLPDGTIRYAENPPKKYEDIVNPDFSSEDAGALWNALRDVVLFWIEQGVKIFRVDNPHTKPFRFWEWLIREVQLRRPDVIFLAEAFTRPKLMKGLAKLGFTQSYTYFTWRTQKWELEQYLTELTGYPERDYYRPNFFVNTPDILPWHLQSGEPWMFKSRVALAATLSATYGIYNGFELLEHDPIPGREEYLDSEKYEIKVRDWDKPGNIKPYIRDLNRARRENPALQQTSQLRFLPIEDGNVIGFVKESVDQTNTVAVAIALSREVHEFWLPLGDVQLGTGSDRRHVAAVENLITGERYPVEWGGIRLRIDPVRDPAYLFRCLA
jgi:starch synthase (maltosyl-transferring)